MGKSHIKLIAVLSFIVLGMFGFGFALVPLYNSLCKTLGINGKVYQDKNETSSAVISPQAREREVLVEFVSTNNPTLPWSFYPKIKKIKIHPGEIARLEFYAENQSNFQMTVQAIPSITPGLAAKYLKKTECFCFTQQTLNGHEAMDMPLIFHLDPDLPEQIHTITLSYTLFDVSNRTADK